MNRAEKVTHVPSILERLVPRSAPASPPAPALGGRDSQTANEKVISAATIVAFVVVAGVGVRVLAGQCGRAVRSRADEVAGAGIEIIISALGGFVIMLVGLFMLGVSANDLLLGGVIIGLLLTATLQPMLANIVAGVSLLLSHPLTVGEHIGSADHSARSSRARC
jgi:small-conductance mechanosensitive channel